MPRKPSYLIPALWNCWGYNGPQKRTGPQVAVDPRNYLDACLRWINAHSQPRVKYAGRSLSQILGVKPAAGKLKVREANRTRRAGDWIKSSTLYAAMIRTSTAWDHNADGKIAAASRLNELGTFLKTILLLPHLHRMGVNVLYLLPVVKVSRLYRKGELGCPYSARNFLELDPDQFDPVLGKKGQTINDQFNLFVESAHRLNIRVMLDLAPRTAARDCDWILEHPEWFCWIDARAARTYKSPRVPGVTYYNPIPSRLHEVYDVPEVRRHLDLFRFPPSVTHAGKWRRFVKQARTRPPKDLVAQIAKHFGVITPPGFSDVINDRQPPWSDVTYFRLFEDHPVASARCLPDPKRQPPYVLFDTAKASLFEGRRPHRDLWNRLADVLPFYQQFGIDGARIDMAHALPNRLERMILDRPRAIDPDFSFIAEELGTQNHAMAHAGGYNMIIGPTWWMQPRGHEGHMHKLVKELPKLKVPIMAAAETPDTPRAVTRRGTTRFARQSVVVNCFLPNAVPMINSGLEILERQPMNLGLDAREKDRFALPKDDPFHGKLAFFDRFVLHWGNRGASRMIDLIARATRLRNEHLDALTDPRRYIAPKVTGDADHVLATAYRLTGKRGVLLMVANLDFKSARKFKVSIPDLRTRKWEVREQLGNPARFKDAGGQIAGQLSPGAVTVCLVQ